MNNKSPSMKNKLLDLYNKYLVIDPPKNDDGIINRLHYFAGKAEKLKYCYEPIANIYFNQLSSYDSYSGSVGNSEYWEPISGRKCLVDPSGRFFSILDLWWPYEACHFNINNSIFILPVVFDIFETKYPECDLLEPSPDLLKEIKASSDIIEFLKSDILEYYKSQEWFGFFVGDVRNSKRTRPLKKRRLEFITTDFKHFLTTLRDKNTGEEITLSYNNKEHWNFYLSEEQLNNRLSDIQTLWMRNFDKDLDKIDKDIKKEKLIIEGLQLKKKLISRSIVEYDKFVKKILWKSF